MNRYKLKWFLYTILHFKMFSKIGIKTYIGKPLFIYGKKGIFIGNRVRIFPNGRFETHNGGLLIISDNCSIGQNFHVVSSNEKLIIGESTTISSNVFISNTDHLFLANGKNILENNNIVKTTKIGNYCFIGTNVSILPGTIIGNNCVVGANSVVKGFFEDNTMIAGNPAKIIKKYNHKSENWEKV